MIKWSDIKLGREFIYIDSPLESFVVTELLYDAARVKVLYRSGYRYDGMITPFWLECHGSKYITYEVYLKKSKFYEELGRL